MPVPTRSIKTLLCDMGNVLVFFCHDRMCRQIGELCGRTPLEIRRELIDSSIQWQFERGFIDEAGLQQRLESLFQVTIPLPQLQKAIADIFDLNDSMIPVLAELKLRGIRLVLFSNTCISHVNYIRSRWNFLDLFDSLILSYEVGAIKPEDRIYEVAMERIARAPHECLYIDDIPAYTQKGSEFGFQTEVFTTTDQFLSRLPNYGILTAELRTCRLNSDSR